MTDPDSKTSETSSEEAAPVESQSPPPSDDSNSAGDSVSVSASDSTSDSVSASDSASDSVSASDTGGEAVADTASGDVGAEAGAESSSGDVAAGEGTESSSGDVAADGGKKKRRRRRKKKGAGAAGTSDAPSEGRPSQHHAPFLHLFSGGGVRKHAFSVGEVVAGRVEKLDRGVVVVDLFGKASAVADADEPRDIPPMIHAATQDDRPSVVPGQELDTGTSTLETAPPMAIPVDESPAPVLTPVVEAPTPEMLKMAQTSEADAWELSDTQISELPDLDLAEADTVVGAQAYVEADTVVGAEPYDPTVPPLELPAPVSATPEGIAQTSTENREAGAAPAIPAEASPGTPEAPPAKEDLSDADLSLLEPLPDLPAPDLGAIFRGRIGAVAESGHIAIVNRDIDKAAVRKALRAARENHQRVQGVVYGFNRGGFDVLVGGVRAFCPASAMSLTPIDDPNSFVGQRCEFSLPQDKGGKRSIIVSRRNILEKEARKRARDRMTELEIGAKLHGKVIEVRDYGVLVDLGDGLDGLVHMSEVSWSRGLRPNQVAKAGDEVDVQVIKVQQATRKDRFGRVSLSMRACQPDPWDAAKDTLRPGVPVKGKVMRTTEFGAFVEIHENIEGLLHISELGGNKELTHAKQALQEGAEIDVVIERVDHEQRRISLSKLSEADARAIEAGEIEVGKAPPSLKPGSHVAVVVKRVEHGGAQVQVDGMLGKRGRGFIPNRELQDLQGENRKGPSQGDIIEVKVIGTDRDGTLRCSIRGRLLDDERRAVKEYRTESAKQGLGTFGDLLKAKLGDSSEP